MDDLKKLFFIYNARSGRGLIRNHLVAILDIFTQAGYLVTAYPTQCARDAYRRVCEAEGQYDLIVCSGGDGTLNEVVSAIMTYSGKKPDLGYIPAGTTNDFAGSLGIPKDMVAAARIIVEERTRTCDVCCFNDRYFIYVGAFGFLTDTSYKTPQNAKNMLGHQAYVFEGFKSLQKTRSYAMKVQGENIETEGKYLYGMVANTTSLGGYKGLVGNDVVLNDGLYEIVLVREPENGQEGLSLVNSIIWQQESPLIERFKASELCITSEEPVDWTLDGEFGGSHTTVQFHVVKHAINLRCPNLPAHLLEENEELQENDA